MLARLAAPLLRRIFKPSAGDVAEKRDIARPLIESEPLKRPPSREGLQLNLRRVELSCARSFGSRPEPEVWLNRLADQLIGTPSASAYREWWRTAISR